MVLSSDDHGTTWTRPRPILPDEPAHARHMVGVSLTYLGGGHVICGVEGKLRCVSRDYGESWTSEPIPPNSDGGAWNQWDPYLVDRDAKTGNVTRVLETGYKGSTDGGQDGYLRSSSDGGKTWSNATQIPQWKKVSEVALVRAANGHLVAACRTDISPRFKGETLDHYEGLGISISSDDGRSWSSVNKLYDWGRHHPSLVTLPNGEIVMAYVVRKGYIDSPEGFPQFGIEAVVSRDHGQTWDLDHKYLLHHWVGNRKGSNQNLPGPQAWWASCQSTSTLLLPDGGLLTAFGTGYRSQPNAQNMPAPRDVGLVQWRLSDQPVDNQRTIQDAAADSDLRNWFDPVTGKPGRGQDAAKGLTASVLHPVHPILIRNEHGPLLRVVVDVETRDDVRARSLTFQFDGTDDVSDLDSLSLFATGVNDQFSAATPVGGSAVPAAEIAFRFDHALREGKNVFWLSCRLKDSANLSHRVAVRCLSIETTAGRLTPRDPLVGATHRIGVALRRHNDDGVHTYRIPVITTSPRGTLLVAYDMRRRMGRDLQEDIDIGLSRSQDGGQTWEPVRVVMDMGEYGGLPQEQNGCSDPGIIVDQQTGEIFVFALWMNGKPGKHQWVDDGSEPGFEIGKSAQLMLVRSKDDGLTWSKPENLTRKLKHESWWLLAPAPQSGFNLPDGTLVMPVQGRTGRKDLETFATVMISRDHGETWTVGKPGYSGGNECQAAPLGDGSIMLNIRNDHERFRAVVVTNDLGQTWKPHATSRNTLIEPNCNGSLLRVDHEQGGEKKHVLLFANPHTQKGRSHQTIQVSFDDGNTWPDSHHLLLDEGFGAGYPSLTRVDQDQIGIVYEGSQSHVVFERIQLADLLQPARRLAAADVWQRPVSPEGAKYLERLLSGTPFGTTNFDFNGLRAGMGTRRLPTIEGVTLTKVNVGDVPCEWVLAPGADPDVRLLYIHGGGFVSGSGGFYLPLAAHLSAAAKCAVLLADYRLAPEHRFPAGLNDCVQAHNWMVTNGPAGPAPARATFVAGDSAGGNLTLATVLALRDRHLPLPAGAIPISACADWTFASDSLRTVHDPIISARTMPVFRDHYLKEADFRDPLASPVFGDYRGLPPLLIQAGEYEMLRDDSIRVAKKARADGASVRLEIWPGMFHVFQSHDPLLPEARLAIDHIGEFIQSQSQIPLKPVNEADVVSIHNPGPLSVTSLRGERISLGEPDDYKPCIARMPDGELLLTAFHQYKRDGGKVMEQTLLFRSLDEGRTWSPPEKLDLLGREPYLTVLADGTVFITGHLLAQDVRNEWGYTCGFLHRSTDRGKTWTSIRFESEGIRPGASNHSTRNVLQLADGSLLLGVDYDGGEGPFLTWRSSDHGKTWDKTRKCQPRDFQSKYGFFGGETWLWQARSGKIWAFVRVDSNELPIKERPIKAGNDQADHFILFSSSDGGKSFDRIRDFGDYGEMYMSLLRLHDKRLLLTFTVRDLHPPLGVRAIVGTEAEEGFEFDFTHDRIMLDTRTPIGKPQGGGFGPSVQLEDGTVVTSYSYRSDDDKTHLEVIRWKPPAEQQKRN
jgi:acetyl esterase/lipase